jgi:aspartate/methionine/tyrosine aminotransferase
MDAASPLKRIMSFRESKRIADVQAPMIPVVGEWIAAHPGTISLAQGVVHFPAPADVPIAVADAVANNPIVDRYSLVRGIDSLLTRIEQKVAAENGVDSRQSCLVTAGSNMAFLNAILAIADVDDEVILLAPYYFNHEMAIEIAGCRAVPVATDRDYQLDLAAIEAAITPRTRAVVTVSPNNPTGVVYSPESLTAVNQLCKARSVYHISDEAYEYFVYDGGTHFSPASIPDSHEHTISLFTLSKAYGMAGWRSGYMTIPQHLEVAVKKIQDTNLICPPIVTQLASAAAMKLGAEWCRTKIAPFQNVRDLVIDELGKLKDRCHVPKPAGAFYALLRLNTDKPDLEIVESLIRDFGIGLMPGSTFGVSEGCTLRIAFGALDSDTVAAGMGRLVKGLQTLI